MTDKSLQDIVSDELDRIAGGAPVAAAVADGVVTLTGVVKDAARRQLIEQEILRMPEVSDVRNHLHVPLPTGEPVEQLRTLFDRAGIDGDGIRIAVALGVVNLSGTARSWFDRDTAERLAWMLPGVHAVENELELPAGAVDPQDDAAEAAVD